jgi:hypothetical protein
MMPVFTAAMNKLVMNYHVMEGFKVRPRVCCAVVPVFRAAMNKLVMNYLVTEVFKVRPRS